ncbi:MAG: hypothetical protein HFF84_01705 [Oscillibacter sp.]|nr:hypothetical protein [Oscillibacter sp.]
MEYTVSATDLANIQLKEEDEVKEILRNVAVILSTPKGSVPMYRIVVGIAVLIPASLPNFLKDVNDNQLGIRVFLHESL